MGEIGRRCRNSSGFESISKIKVSTKCILSYNLLVEIFFVWRLNNSMIKTEEVILTCSEATPAKRLLFFDIAKGISIICIILGHIEHKQIQQFVFTFHVPIFFLITGYFITEKRSIKAFIKNKFKTLIVPYICTCIVIILLGTLRDGLFYGMNAAKESATGWLYASLYGSGIDYSEPFYIKAIGAIWFLWASFWGSIFLRCTLGVKWEYRFFIVGVLFLVGYYSRELFWFPLSIQAGYCATLFIYLGNIARKLKTTLENVSIEIKSVFTVFAIWMWVAFIYDFKGFYLVECDFGRGIVDIVGCLCGSYVIIMASQFIEKHSKYISAGLSYLGKYSLIALCVHIVELNLFPWGRIADFLIAYGMPVDLKMCFIILGKLLMVIAAVIIFSKWNFSRKLFGYKVLDKKVAVN